MAPACIARRNEIHGMRQLNVLGQTAVPVALACRCGAGGLQRAQAIRSAVCVRQAGCDRAATLTAIQCTLKNTKTDALLVKDSSNRMPNLRPVRGTPRKRRV